MLNSDISDAETQPQPDSRSSSVSSNFSLDVKMETRVKTTSPPCEGLLKIASPLPNQPPPPPKCPVTPEPPSPSPPPSPGPPVLEPMTSTVSQTQVTNNITTTTRSAVTTATTTSNNNNKTIPVISTPLPPPPQMSASVNSAAPIQQIILPPVQAGQQQQFVLQPQQLAGLQPQFVQPQPQLQQQQQPLLTQAQPPVIQIVPGSVPLQFNNNPIPLLSAQGQVLATVGGINNQGQLISNLQNFVMMVQPTLQPQLIQPQLQQPLNNQIIIKQEPNVQPQQVKTLPMTPSTPQTPIKIGTPLQSTTPLISNQPNFIQPPQQSFSVVPQQPQLINSSISTPQQQPNMFSTPTTSILQPQSNAMNILANNTNQITTSSSINLLPTTATQPNMISLPQTAPTISTSQPSTPPTMQLVQDPSTGLYNLVTQQQQQQQQQLQQNTTPLSATAPKLLAQQPLSTGESPIKRSGTPVMGKGSPVKMPKLLLPSLPGTKENKPSQPDPRHDPPPAKQFKCGVCNKYFGNQKNLRVHISEIHEGKRGQFPCDICHKVFPRKRNMERHKNALHLKNSPQCYMCHKSVVNLEMHIKRFHKGSTDIKIKVEEAVA